MDDGVLAKYPVSRSGDTPFPSARRAPQFKLSGYEKVGGVRQRERDARQEYTREVTQPKNVSPEMKAYRKRVAEKAAQAEKMDRERSEAAKFFPGLYN